MHVRSLFYAFSGTLIVLLFFGVLAPSARAAEAAPAPAPAPADKATAPPADQAAPETKVVSESPTPRDLSGWYMFWGVSNVYPRLRESERKIDQLLNNGVGVLFPRWEEPTTFADWRNKGMLWDSFVGVGQDFADKWSWAGTVGFSSGKILNSYHYRLFGLPVDFRADFHRTLNFVSAAVSYYPWGRPEASGKESGYNFLSRMLRDARPFTEVASGYVHLARLGDTRFALHGVNRFLRVVDSQDDNLFYISPRVAVEFPIDENDSLNLMVGALFFTSHSEEYNSVTLYMFHRHKF